MRVAVMGAKGMLGRQVCTSAVERGHRVTKCIGSILYPDVGKGTEVIINCAGVIPQRSDNIMKMIEANALGPHRLAKLGIRIIHVSTDCVFKGDLPIGQLYGPTYETDATTVYGRSKALGEVVADHVTNVRTSFIGPDHGLQHWLMTRPLHSTVQGWQNAMWSGSTVYEVANAIVRMLDNLDDYQNIEHLATEKPISKWWLLQQLALEHNPTVRVVPEILSVPINRGLFSTIQLRSPYD